MLLLLAAPAVAQERVEVTNGTLHLKGLLFRPEGRGPFPAVLFNHGSGPSQAPHEARAAALGPVFARHGYAFLYLCRRGVGLSAGQGENGFDAIQRAAAEHGADGRNATQLELLQGAELEDAAAGLAYLRARPDVDGGRLAVVGHSFGGATALLQAERDGALRAVVTFGAAALSWPRSPPLQKRLLAAVSAASAPIFFIHAANDYSVVPGKTLAARRRELRMPQKLEIYPAVGRTADDGHDFVYSSIAVWEADVFRFLDAAQRAE